VEGPEYFRAVLWCSIQAERTPGVPLPKAKDCVKRKLQYGGYLSFRTSNMLWVSLLMTCWQPVDKKTGTSQAGSGFFPFEEQ
jgi:hypothetical protein